MVYLVSWNVNGIRAVMNKGFIESVKEMNPDVLCLQETKAHPDQVDHQLKELGYDVWSNIRSFPKEVSRAC